MRKLILSVAGGILCSSFTIVPPLPNIDDKEQQAGIITLSSDISRDHTIITDLGQFLQKRLYITVINEASPFIHNA